MPEQENDTFVENTNPDRGERELDPVGAGVDATGKKVAHWHQPDRRARQTGPVVEGDLPIGRQKKEPCYEIVYDVRNPGGFKINEILYTGRVRVPTCVGNYLAHMDREWERAERNMFRNNRVDRTVGQF